MRKAILCFAHKDPVTLNTLIDQSLYKTNGQTDFYIHLDKKSEHLKDLIRKSSNVFYIQNNVSVTWGDDTMMRALVNSWKEIFSKGKDYEYFIMCTGQDLMVKSGLDEFLENNKGGIWIDAKEGDVWRKRYIKAWWPAVISRDLSRYPRWNYRRLIRGIYTTLVNKNIYIPRRLSYDISKLTFYYSYNWSIMPYGVFVYCYEFIRDNPDFVKMYLNTRVPEDGFLGTLIMNSPYKNDVQFNGRKDGWTATQTYHTDIYIHPRTFDNSDIIDIDNSNCYFARKFDSAVDASIIEYYRNKVIK